MTNEDKAQYIFETLEVGHISMVDFHRLTKISRETLYRWRRNGGKRITDQFRLNFAYTMAQRLREAVNEGVLPLTDKLKKEARVNRYRAIIHRKA
jgi:transposase-like protein